MSRVYAEMLEIGCGFKGYSHPFKDIDDDGDFFLFSCFPKNKKTMTTPFVVLKEVEDIGSYYTFDDEILHFPTWMEVSSSEDKETVILEACSPSDKVTTLVSPLIKDMGFVFHCSPFSIEVMRVLNIAPTQLFSNSWGFIKAFETACEYLDVTPALGVFFIFLYYQTREG